MDLWQRARSFAEEAAKKSQELTQGINSANFSEVVSEASRRTKDLAAEASKKSKEIAAEALKRADQIKAQIPPPAVTFGNLVESVQKGGIGNGNGNGNADADDLEKFGVTDELREFVKGITMNTFQDFPLEDDSEMSDIPTVSNVRQDLTEWQERHAKLVLSSVKEISKLRYQLCPRIMKERKFWRIYFILVNSHLAPYEKRYMEDEKLKSAERAKDSEVKETSAGGASSQTNTEEIPKPKNNNTKSAASEQDLDVFLLGDLEDSDDGPDSGDDGFDDDFDKI